MKFSLGRYVPYNSLIHRIDPRAKLLAVLLLMICIFFPYQSWAMTFAVDGGIFLLLAILLYMTRTKITDILRSLILDGADVYEAEAVYPKLQDICSEVIRKGRSVL